MPKTVVVVRDALPDDAREALSRGFAKIRAENDVPAEFPGEVLAAAEQAVQRKARISGASHIDRTDVAFVTLDPATSTDLDQAFAIERGTGDTIVLRYAIADVGWFVAHGDALDVEAWQRGVTIYLPDGRTSLYPTSLSEGAASLLPDGPRPAVVFTVRIAGDGAATLDGVERAVIRSRAKLAYDTASAADLPAHFDELAARIAAAEQQRGASRVDTPEQAVESDGSGGFTITFRPRLSNEDANAAMSLATNLSVADLLMANRTGLFRVMDEPDERSVRRLRFTAKALGLTWPDPMPLGEFERTLKPNIAKHAAFSMAVRRAGGGADYAPFADGVVPWHAAMAATYAHATAPLRRLADRYVIEAALALANGQPVPDDVTAAFTTLPDVMDKAEARAARIDRAVIDLVEAVTLHGCEGRTYDAVVTDTDERGARIQLVEPAVVARVNARRVEPGDEVVVRLVNADPVKRSVEFERIA